MTEASSSHPSLRAFEIVLEVIINLMMPLFMGGTTYNSDPDVARTAAIEMLNCFQPRDSWEVLTGAQIAGFGLAALGSIGLSMQPGLSVPLSLRVRSNANSLHRSGNQARKALDAYRVNYPETGPREFTPQMAEALAASVQEVRQLSAEAEAVLRGPAQPSPRHSPGADARAPNQARAETAPPAPHAGAASQHPAVAPAMTAINAAPGTSRTAPVDPLGSGAVQSPATQTAVHREVMSEAERRKRAIWALGVARASQEMAAEMEHLPPSARAEQQMKIAALSASAQHLMSGVTQAQVPPAMSPHGGSGGAGHPTA